MRTYPIDTSNRNVPKNVLLLSEVSYPEENITYYIDTAGWIWKVGDWVTDIPRKTSIREACMVTGDTENMIELRWKQWKKD